MPFHAFYGQLLIPSFDRFQDFAVFTGDPLTAQNTVRLNHRKVNFTLN